jgi:hypothetical protein
MYIYSGDNCDIVLWRLIVALRKSAVLMVTTTEDFSQESVNEVIKHQ